MKKREIKFRVWDKEEGMIYINSSTDTHVLGGEYAYEIISSGEYPTMQYTGLKDKNGVEVYEGDVVKVNGEYMEVYFKDGYFGWGWEHEGVYSFDPFGVEEIEVIGNIYENPELVNFSK
jgi:uncharacterized phage protein (TIGR01671 family)